MIKKIFVSVDLSTPTITEKVCKSANDMAAKYDAEVQLVTILPDYGTPLVASFFPEGAQDKIKAELNEKLKALAAEHFTTNVKVGVIHSSGAKRANSILSTIDKLKPDLVILGCRRKHSRNSQRLLGSTTLSVADRAECPVLLVK
ncbi:MAG: nucleotide-binding universal stress UspA family protein [Cocleimonas sp.]|jgi:nucleotide-binding universal stress UspA family protein